MAVKKNKVGRNKKKKYAKPISLYPLKLGDILKAVLRVPQKTAK
jgi:hypothetical protein